MDKEQMTDMTETPKSGFARRLPMIAIALVAVIGAFTLKDFLSFEVLADNREALIAFRDANYFLTVAVFLLLYAVIVAFSLPGATIATLAGGFLVRHVPGLAFQYHRRNHRRGGDLSGRALGLWRKAGCQAGRIGRHNQAHQRWDR